MIISVKDIGYKHHRVSEIRNDRFKFNKDGFFKFANDNKEKYQLLEKHDDLLIDFFMSFDLIYDYNKKIITEPMITKEDLKEYGNVEICEEINGELHIKVTKGFSSKMVNTFNVFNKIIEKSPQYTLIKKCVTDDNLLDIILTPKD